MNITKSLYLLTGTMLAFSVAGIAQTSLHKLSLTKGQKLQIDNTVNSLITQEMMGQTMEIKADASTQHQVEVKDTKDASYLLSATFTKLKTNTSMMGQDMSFDSDKKDDMEGDQGKMFKDQLNVAKDVELTHYNKVINAPKKEDKKDEPAGGMMDMMKGLTGGEADESNGASAAFEVIPADAKAGSSWQDSSITAEVKTYRTYTVKEIKGNDAILSLSGKQSIKKTIEQNGMEITVNTDAKISGEETVDISTGIIKQKKVVMDSAGNASVMGQEVPLTTVTTTVTTVKSL